MVSPVQSIAANLRPAPNPLMQLGDVLRQNRVAQSQIDTNQARQAEIERQSQAQQGQQQRGDALQQAQFLNRLGKRLLSTPDDQWPALLGPQVPALQAMGIDISQIQGATREQVQAVVAQTDPLFTQENSLEQEKLGIRQEELEERKRVSRVRERELKPGVQKILDSAQNSAVESGARARQLGLLASDLETAGDIGGGATTRFSEFLKTQLGTQDDVTELRRRFNAIRSSEAVQNLPPGVASDKDIELALKGFPREDAPKTQLVSFLRGAQKLAQFQEKFNTVKSELISEKGSTRGLLRELKEKIPDIQVETTEEVRSTPEVTQVAQSATITADETQKGGRIMVDAQGNRAVVFPDGTFREL